MSGNRRKSTHFMGCIYIYTSNIIITFMIKVILYYVQIFIFVICICLVSFFWYGRFIIFQQSYTSFVKQLVIEKWLLSQCNNDIFFGEMQLVSDICRQVISNSRVSPLLHALSKTVGNTLMNNTEL